MTRLALALLLLWAAAFPARAEEVLAALSQTQVALTADFSGAEILVFGAVRRESPVEADPPLAVIVTIEGPSTPVTVWRKSRRAGIWVNTESVRISSAPSFYAVASTGPLDQVLSATEDLRHRITIPRAIRSIGAAMAVDDPAAFTDALIRVREDAQLYQTRERSVDFARDTLFSTRISLPATLTEGVYATRIFLTRGGEVVDQFHSGIDVRKAGFERALFLLAQDEPLIYGVLAVLIAALAGWGASEAFRYLRS